jgi:hypothetical protein
MEDARHDFDSDQTVLEADEPKGGRNVNPLKAVRRHCLWCCNGSANEG